MILVVFRKPPLIITVIQLVLSTTTDKNTPSYNVTARFTNKKDKSSQWKQVVVKTPFSRWFSADGYFVAKPFQQWLASEIPAVGAADPSNIVEDIGRGSATAAPKMAVSSGPTQRMNVGIENLPDMLNHLKTQGQGGQARRRG